MTTLSSGSEPRPARGSLGAITLLREAAAWRLLGLALERPRHGWEAELEELSAELADPGLAALVARARGEGSEGRYLARLGPNGVASPRAAGHWGRADPARNLADLRGFYEAFGWQPANEDPPDHVAVEAGFAGYLLLKEAVAGALGQPQAAETTAAARAAFLRDHLAPLAWRLADRLEALGDASWLQAAARALAERTGLPAPPPADAPIADDDGAEPAIDCPAGACP